ncbi:manganese efflux pump [Paenibacillus sp. P36]|uniref:manganese efflux pump n=1 Tax=Paenibacillus sp. P36 TaxID=3342538 RepID=UPI0038B2D7E5
MHWLSILGIGLAANLDNLGIGFSFGARSTKIPFSSNLLIAILSIVSAYASIAFGHLVANYIPPAFANWIGGSMIIIIGLWSIKTNIKEMNSNGPTETSSELANLLKNPARVDRNGDNIISWTESWTLGLALALNCIASGFGAGVTGVSALGTTLSIGVFSLLTVALGVRVGKQIAQTWFGRYSNAIGGLILIGIGIYEIVV